MPRPLIAALAGLLVIASVATGSAQPSAAERDALKNARILDIIGVTRDVDGVLRDLGATVSDQEIRIELAADVLFDFDKADIKPAAFPTLQKVGEAIKAYPTGAVLIEGHTDSVGAEVYNMKLSESRAASVRAWLVERAGVPAARTSAAGRGETKPVVPNAKPDNTDDPVGRQKNRRVEITIKKAAK